MPEIKDINISDLENEGRFHSNLPDVPSKSPNDMKAFFDYIPKEVIIPKVNEILDELNRRIDFSHFNQAYIKSGKLVCNDAADEGTAKYIGVNMHKPITHGEIRFGFTGEIDNIFDPEINPEGKACTALIITSALGCQRSRDIIEGSWHIGISPVCATIEYYEKGIEKSKATLVYKHRFAEALLPDTEYRFLFQTLGTKLDNGEYAYYLAFTFPVADVDGKNVFTNKTIPMSLEKWNEYNGQYVIFEHFYTNAVTCRPYFTGWQVYATDDIKEFLDCRTAKKTALNTNYLRHDFKQSVDGPLICSPTGQPYSLFADEVHGGTGLDH